MIEMSKSHKQADTATDLQVEVGEDGQGHKPDAGHRLHQRHLRAAASRLDCRTPSAMYMTTAQPMSERAAESQR